MCADACLYAHSLKGLTLGAVRRVERMAERARGSDTGRPQAPVSSLLHVIGHVLGSVLKEVFSLMAHGKAIFPQAISLNWHQRGGNLTHCVV